LLEQGKATLNGKLLDTARAVLQRHHVRVTNAADVMQQIDELKQRYASGTGKMLVGDGNGRKEGGIALRTAASQVNADGEAVPVPEESTSA
jgi:hypothetical protein